ncbi:MAG: pilus assembly protein PilP [Sinimarinibacterium sp.]
MAAASESASMFPLSIQVKDISAPGLVFAVADILEQDMVFLGDPFLRVSLEGRYASAAEAWKGLGDRLGLDALEADGLRLLVPRGCVPDGKGSGAEVPLAGESVIFNFSRVSPAVIAGHLAEVGGLTLAAGVDDRPIGQLIGFRLREGPPSAAARVLSSVTGTRLRQRDDGKFDIVESPDPRCSAPPASPRELGALLTMRDFPAALHAPRRPINDYNPRGQEPTEEFALADLAARGRIETPAFTVGLVEAPTGITHQVVRDNYLGQDYGKVTTVDAAGIALLELFPRTAADGGVGWEERATRLNFSAASPAVEPGRPKLSIHCSPVGPIRAGTAFIDGAAAVDGRLESAAAVTEDARRAILRAGTRELFRKGNRAGAFVAPAGARITINTYWVGELQESADAASVKQVRTFGYAPAATYAYLDTTEPFNWVEVIVERGDDSEAEPVRVYEICRDAGFTLDPR